ncbi:deoxyribodipyrimidine photo-lyase [Amycolatopsis sp. 195334CR]|uniref:cryptochrome/photolyase family protein n=1 Tax=Amycolatopsis sp. 195334CR TaxID=2814588 RepID=UPI001A90584D|nr:deoxyribodipyrimidine photo-lyase [Amycolatopsis sp. 195334CR]MBN6037949.1 deoxyribodipyrimidine photo-lyase [Amycolatopsis sp. 195334CR]
MSVAIALFTRDLRVHDNPVLTAAAKADRVIPLFVLDERITGTPNRAAFLAACLRDLDAGLKELGARLVNRRGNLVDEVCAFDADEVHVAADVSAFAHRREDALREALGDRLVVHDAVTTVLAPGAVTPTGGKDHFAVFTPYFRRWSEADRRSVLEPPRLTPARVRLGKVPSAKDICAGKTAPGLPDGGERAGRELVDDWFGGQVDEYTRLQDDMAAGGTSRLSPHLHFGSVSANELVHRAGRSAGAEAFVRQLAWRDFHHQVLAARPASSHTDYRSHGDRWRKSTKDLDAWREGRTGVPIVDAGMRQLLREGWMHNRARLIVGSFLTKTLYVDWREGARHFLAHLVDADVANNQLNWQWVAGTGTDTRPNRVLNPILQGKRYDPRGDYVREYVPELSGIEGPAVHEPWKHSGAEDYPSPIVDLRTGADRFLRARGK